VDKLNQLSSWELNPVHRHYFVLRLEFVQFLFAEVAALDFVVSFIQIWVSRADKFCSSKCLIRVIVANPLGPDNWYSEPIILGQNLWKFFHKQRVSVQILCSGVKSQQIYREPISSS
jgi:hypothetical protein